MLGLRRMRKMIKAEHYEKKASKEISHVLKLLERQRSSLTRKDREPKMRHIQVRMTAYVNGEHPQMLLVIWLDQQRTSSSTPKRSPAAPAVMDCMISHVRESPMD